MTTVTPLDFIAALYPDPVAPGQLLLRSKIRRSGREHSDWCCTPRQAARRVEQCVHTRDIHFGVALQDRDLALSRARRRRPRASPARILGCADAVTALPALWAEIPVAGPGADDGSALPPDPAAGRALLEEISRPPSILVWTGTGFDAYWRLEELWVLATPEHRRAAERLLRQLQGALQRRAEEEGWRLDRPADLGRMLRLPGSFRRLGHRRLEVTVERFPLYPGATEDRSALADFAGLDEAPRSESRERPWDAGEDDEPPTAAPADFRRVWEGCSWLRHAYHDRAVLPEAEWRMALSIAGRSEVADGPRVADGRTLAQRFSAGHPGYTREGTAEELGRLLRRKTGPATCRRIALQPGVRDDHCGHCPHLGRLDSPLDLGRRTEAPRPRVATAPGAAGEPGPPADFVAGLEELLAECGGRATAREMVAALAGDEKRERFATLRSALGRLFPRLDGAVPTPLELGYRLRSFAGRSGGGRTIVHARKSTRGVTWAVRSAAGGRPTTDEPRRTET